MEVIHEVNHGSALGNVKLSNRRADRLGIRRWWRVGAGALGVLVAVARRHVGGKGGVSGVFGGAAFVLLAPSAAPMRPKVMGRVLEQC